MTSRRRATMFDIALNVARGVLFVLTFMSQFPPIVHWPGHQAILIGGLALFTVDWIVGSRHVSRRFVPIFIAGAVYTGVTALGLILFAEHAPRSVLMATAGVVVTAACAALFLAVREGRRTKELDRLIFSEASSIAFFATMIAIVTVALVDEWLGYRAPSLWVFAAIGAVSWLGARLALQSRYH